MVLFQRSRKAATFFAVTGLTVATVAGLGATSSTAAPTAAPPKPSQAQSKALAAKSVSSLLAAPPAGIHASKNDKFVAKSIISDPSGLQYVPYERTFKGLPVVGGDFVVVTDANGAIKDTSVAQTVTIPDLSTKAGITAAAAKATATKLVKQVTSSTQPALAVYALSGKPQPGLGVDRHGHQRQGADEPVRLRRRHDRQGAEHQGARDDTATGRRRTAARTRCTWTPRCPAARTR